MAGKQAYKERVRTRIITEAAAAMRSNGLNGISVGEVMKRAGLTTHGSFYAHFANRDDLVAHAVDRMFEDSDALVRHCFSERAPADGLARLIDAYLSDEALLLPERSCPIPSLSGEVPRMPDDARARFQAGIRRFQDALTAALSELGEDLPDSLAASLLAEMAGAMALARAAEPKESARLLTRIRAELKDRLSLEPEAAGVFA